VDPALWPADPQRQVAAHANREPQDPLDLLGTKELTEKMENMEKPEEMESMEMFWLRVRRRKCA